MITTGFLLATDTLAAAEANPETNFIGIDQFQPEFPDNYVGVLFNEDEGGYMAGVMAASLSESGTIGVVGGREDVPPVVKLVNGYEAGAKSVEPGHHRAEDLQRVLRRHGQGRFGRRAVHR